MITVMAGGVGAARLLAGLQLVHPPDDLTAIVNVADDLELYGLAISPDLDTVTYTLAGEIDPDRGWGLRDESWQAMQSLRTLGAAPWFNLGDRDLGTHLYRTARIAQGASLSEVTLEISERLGVRIRLLPVTNDRLRTRVRIVESGEATDIAFQDYFVRLAHSVPVQAVHFDGADQTSPAPGVIDAIESAERVVIAPSNPIVSIGPVLAVRGVRAALEAKRDSTIAVSPIIAGAALKGPADRMLAELGHEASVVGIAKLYAQLACALVIDDADAHHCAAISAAGMTPVVAPTIMSDPDAAAALGRVVLSTPLP